MQSIRQSICEPSEDRFFKFISLYTVFLVLLFSAPILGVIVGLLITGVLYNLISDHTTTLLIFPDSKMPCKSLTNRLLNSNKTHTCWKKDSCTYYHGNGHSSLLEFYKILAKAEKSIDICVYRITVKSMAQFVIELTKSKGVKVRIVTDASGDDDDKNHLERVGSLQQAANITVKTNDPKMEGKMHNKFVIIDKKIGMIGSFNWSHNAIMKNNETVIVSSQPDLVNGLNKEFSKLWSANQARNVDQLGVDGCLIEPYN